MPYYVKTVTPAFEELLEAALPDSRGRDTFKVLAVRKLNKRDALWQRISGAGDYVILAEATDTLREVSCGEATGIIISSFQKR